MVVQENNETESLYLCEVSALIGEGMKQHTIECDKCRSPMEKVMARIEAGIIVNVYECQVCLNNYQEIKKVNI